MNFLEWWEWSMSHFELWLPGDIHCKNSTVNISAFYFIEIIPKYTHTHTHTHTHTRNDLYLYGEDLRTKEFTLKVTHEREWDASGNLFKSKAGLGVTLPSFSGIIFPEMVGGDCISLCLWIFITFLELLSACGMWASHCSLWSTGSVVWASVVAAWGLSSRGLQALEHGLSCGTWA